MARVEFRALSKVWDEVRAVDALSLDIVEGSFTALLGPSGCGKSTLLRLAAGLERPTAGHILIDGRDVTTLPPERRGVGMMFQSYALFPHMSVAGNIAFPLRMAGERDRRAAARRVEEALALVRLPGMGDRGVRQLSGGQQQRVALARAFVARPRVLLLDEPLSNLDARLREEMQVELIELHRQLGLTTLFVTHDQEEALSLADHVVLMRAGRIEQQGTPEDLYARPATPFAADFIGAANLLEVVVSREGDAWLAAIGAARIPVPAPDDGRAGPRQLMIRQEDVTLADGPMDGMASIPATVQTRVYRGATARYVMRAGGQTVMVVASKDVRAPVRAERHLAWPPDRAVIL